MPKKDYYETLNVSKNAGEREIKRAYKRLAMKFHPDRNPGNSEAESKFKEAKEAYETLIDPQKRASYDRYGHTGFQQNSSSEHFTYSTNNADFGDIFGDVFGDIFGTQKSQESQESDLCVNITLTLEEAVQGTTKKIRVSSLEKCPCCLGSGTKPGTSSAYCSACEGRGKIQMRQSFFTVQQICPVCRGEKKIIRFPCGECRGSGKTKQSKILAIKIPSGVNTGDRIRISEKGKTKNNNSGNLYVQITVKKHPIFERREQDLYCEIPINFAVAALGGEIQVPTLGYQIKLKIPSETQTGKLFRIRGRGVKSVHKNIRGDLLCKVIVETPVRLNRVQHKLLKKLSVSFSGPNKEKNSPRSKNFFDRVKKFFDDLRL